MKKVAIYPDIKVFGDPNFCAENSPTGFCDQLYKEGKVSKCHQFPESELEWAENGPASNNPVKCDQCKELFKQSLSEEYNAKRVYKTV